MRQVARRLWDLLRRLADRPPCRPAKRPRPSVRLELCALEDRLTPSVSTLGTLSGAVVLGGAVQPGQFFSFQGIQVTLSGTSDQGNPVDMTVTTDGSGTFAFRSVDAGTYDLSASADATLLQGGDVPAVTVLAGQSTTQDVTVGGLAPGAISLRDFLNTIQPNSFNLPTPGPTSDNPPVVSAGISNLSVAAGGSTTIDLAAHFSDPDMTNSQVVFDTSDGPMVVNLNDTAAPQTVANFLDYVETSRYDSTIFHRLDTSPPVLQGGGFGLQTNSSGDVTAFPSVANANDPLLTDEASSSAGDTLGTLAMAQPSGNANGATSEFFFNLANNQSALAGNFAVFGSVASDATSQAVFQALQSTPVQNESAFNPAFGGTNPTRPTLPISSAANLTNFPTNTTPADYLTINDIHVVKQDESLTYSVVGNTNPSVVSTSFVDGHPEVLSLNGLGQAGTSTITVQATDDFGLTVQTSFQVTVDPLNITAVTNPINNTNASSVMVSGVASPNAQVVVTAADANSNTATVGTVTANSSGVWTATGSVSTLADGTITFTASTTAADGSTVTATTTSTKNTVAPTVAINSPAPAVTLNNENAVTVSGTVTAGATVAVTAGDGTTTTTAQPATVSGGTWSVTLNTTTLKDGTITYTAVATGAGGNTTTTATATKSTVAITSVPASIDGTNDTNTSVTGTTEDGASVSVTASDGTNKVTAPPVTADPSTGDWTVSGIDVSGLNNGTITYTATATDPNNGNTAKATGTTTKTA